MVAILTVTSAVILTVVVVVSLDKEVNLTL